MSTNHQGSIQDKQELSAQSQPFPILDRPIMQEVTDLPNPNEWIPIMPENVFLEKQDQRIQEIFKDVKLQNKVDNSSLELGPFQNLANQSIYVGQWKNGMPHGKGHIIQSDNSFYDGEFQQGKKQGYGIQKWGNGRVYKGQWFQGEMKGNGTLQWPDGSKYEGEFLEGKKHGEGEYMQSDGKIFRGQFQNDYQEGVGIFINEQGFSRKSEWKEGKLIKWLENTKQSQFLYGKKSGSLLAIFSFGLLLSLEILSIMKSSNSS